MRGDGHDVVQQARDLREHHPDVLRAQRDLRACMYVVVVVLLLLLLLLLFVVVVQEEVGVRLKWRRHSTRRGANNSFARIYTYEIYKAGGTLTYLNVEQLLDGKRVGLRPRSRAR